LIKGQIKSCGSCTFFIKLKNDKYGGGLCEFLDGRTKTSFKGCKYWNNIPYDRIKEKRKFEKIKQYYEKP
jgi:hypothetical protein